MNSLYLIGFIQSAFFALLILSKSKLKLSDVFLVLFILIMGFRLLGIYLFHLGAFETRPEVYLLKYVYWPLFGPFLYLYIATITSDTQKFKTGYWLHFLPSFLIIILLVWYFANGNDAGINTFFYPGKLYMIGMFAWFALSIVYFGVSIAKLHSFEGIIEQYFSYKEKIDLGWLRVLTYGFGIFLLLSLSFILSMELFGIGIPGFYEHISWLIITLYIFCIAYYGYRQRWIFSSAQLDSTKNRTGRKEKQAQYEKTKLSETENDKIRNELLDLMNARKPYLNSELNIESLSNEIGTSPYKLSQVINLNFQKNFYEFVNDYRIEEAKNYLKDPQFAREKIMNIAYDCGFSSKSSFFSVFKKRTAQTPSGYKKSQLSA